MPKAIVIKWTAGKGLDPSPFPHEHANKHEANLEAERLAKLSPGTPFCVEAPVRVFQFPLRAVR